MDAEYAELKKQMENGVARCGKKLRESFNLTSDAYKKILDAYGVTNSALSPPQKTKKKENSTSNEVF